MVSKKAPKVLIVSVNPLSETSNNGKTYASFFEGYPKEAIAQLYFHREIPSSHVCDNYYRISDEDIFRKMFKKKSVLGGMVFREDVEMRVIPQKVNNILKKMSSIKLIRSLLLSLISIERKELFIWLDEFKPDIIFFSGGDANYLYSKVLKLSEKYKSKVVNYITDDYVLLNCNFNLFNQLNRLWTRKVFDRMCKESSITFTIGEKMALTYKEKYGVNSSVLMNMVNIPLKKDLQNDYTKVNELKFVYAGSLHSRRWEMLSLIGQCLKEIDNKGIKANLEIYSIQKPEPKILNSINIASYSKYCGSLKKDELENVLGNADVLIHVESFNKKSSRETFLSVSTKIPEYMAKGKCILAVGPKQIASIEYLINTRSAYVLTSNRKEEIINTLISLITNPDQRLHYANNAYETAKKNHDSTKVRREFQQKLRDILLK